MLQLGIAISSEEQKAEQILATSRLAEESGFSYIALSDHFHPWTDSQGQSTFVWSMLGAISQITKKIDVMTAVTAPVIRIHPVILAQAVATTTLLFGDRFSFGVGTGENLNEHVVGLGWPSYHIRAAMLREAIQLIRQLWEGKMTSFTGEFYTVDTARIYSLPKQLPTIIVSALGPKSATLAAEIGDGLMTTSADKTVLTTFKEAGGDGKPIYGQMKVVVHESKDEAKKIAYKYWPFTGIPGQAHQELRIPQHFEEIGKAASPETLAKQIVCGRDVEQHLKKIQEFIDAGYTHVAVGQIGPDQKAFTDFYQKEIFPKLSGLKQAKQQKPTRPNGRTVSISL